MAIQNGLETGQNQKCVNILGCSVTFYKYKKSIFDACRLSLHNSTPSHCTILDTKITFSEEYRTLIKVVTEARVKLQCKKIQISQHRTASHFLTRNAAILLAEPRTKFRTQIPVKSGNYRQQTTLRTVSWWKQCTSLSKTSLWTTFKWHGGVWSR